MIGQHARKRTPRAGLRAVRTGEMRDATELLQRTALGDQAAFAELYDLVAAPVYGLIRRVLRDPAQSEEVAQEVMLEIWKQAPRFSSARGSANAWMLTIAHRRAVDRVRSEESARKRDDRTAAEAEERHDIVAEEVETRMERERVRRALGSLTELQREAVELAYYGGHTYREVAQLLQAPEGTVKTRLRDGLIRLRDELGVGQ